MGLDRRHASQGELREEVCVQYVCMENNKNAHQLVTDWRFSCGLYRCGPRHRHERSIVLWDLWVKPYHRRFNPRILKTPNHCPLTAKTARYGYD